MSLVPKKYRKHLSEDHVLLILEIVQGIPHTTPLVPYLKSRFCTYYFPKPKLENATVAQFVFADDYYKWLLQALDDGDDQKILLHTKQLLCTLARRKGKHVISKDQIKKEAARMPALLLRYSYVAIQYFSACKQWIYEQYGTLFSGEGQKGGIDLGWHGSVMGVAESGVMGDLKNVYQENIHTFLLFLVKKKQDADALEASYKQKT